jgi:hypothetical protein
MPPADGVGFRLGRPLDELQRREWFGWMLIDRGIDGDKRKAEARKQREATGRR